MKEQIKIQLIKVVEFIKLYWFKVPENYRRILRITGIVFVSLIVLMFLSSLFFSVKKTANGVKKKTPAPLPQITILPDVVVNPSRYATDSAILKIEEDLKTVEKELDGLQVNEINLLPPRLDFNVTFEK